MEEAFFGYHSLNILIFLVDIKNVLLFLSFKLFLPVMCKNSYVFLTFVAFLHNRD